MAEGEIFTEDGRRFPSWEALVGSEAHGWVATAILRDRAPKGTLFTWTVGPYPTKREATNAGARIRTKSRKDNGPSELVTITVKPAWKEVT